MQKVSILVAEDQPEILDILASCLSIFCRTIYKAKDGLEAFELYNKYFPDIILTDINMPRLNGIQFIKK